MATPAPVAVSQPNAPAPPSPTAPPPSAPQRLPSSVAAAVACKDRPQLVSCSNGNQHYSLRWNNHQSHVLSAFETLLQGEILVDCTLVCEDASIKAHKVVLSACSPYFQQIFVDNPCKHPIIVLKDIRGWEVQCIVDFMYKGETSVPEVNLTSLIKAAESLKVRGLTSSDQTPRSPGSIVPPPPPPPSHNGSNGYNLTAHPPSHHAPRGYSPSPVRSSGGYTEQTSQDGPASKMAHIAATQPQNGSTSSQSSPMSLTNHQDDRDRAMHRASPGPQGPGSQAGPRRKQARPRRRSGDSIGNASLDLSKSDSPPLSSVSGASNNNSGLAAPAPRSPHGPRDHSAPPSAPTNTQRPKNSSSMNHHQDETPENLSLNRPSSQPAINLVKTEHLMEEARGREHARPTTGHPPMERAHSSDPHLSSRAAHPPGHMPPNAPHDMHHDLTHGRPKPSPTSPFLAAAAAAAAGHGPPIPPPPPHSNGPDKPYGLHSFQEHEARAEALQALNFMAAGGGLPHHFPGHPLAGHQAAAAAAAAHAQGNHHGPGPHGPPHALNSASLASLAAAGAAAQAAAAAAHSQNGRPTSTPSTPSNAFPGDPKNNFNIQQISIDRSKMSEEEAFEHAIDMIQTRQMGFRKAADFFSVSKWKLYKTARKRGIYAEIKKQNAAQQALTKVPTNVQHFADMGVYKQLKKAKAAMGQGSHGPPPPHVVAPPPPLGPHAAAAATAAVQQSDKGLLFPHLPPPGTAGPDTVSHGHGPGEHASAGSHAPMHNRPHAQHPMQGHSPVAQSNPPQQAPPSIASDPHKVFKAPTNNNHHNHNQHHHHQSPVNNNNTLVSAFGIDPMSLQKKLSGFHRTAAEQMLNCMSQTTSSSSVNHPPPPSPSHQQQQHPLPLVHSTTSAHSAVQRSSHEENDMSDMEDDMDEEDLDMDENIDIVDDIEPTTNSQTLMRPPNKPDVMERIPRDEGEDDDDCDDRRLVINHSESSVSPTSGMTGSSHPSSGVPSPAPGVNGLRPEAVGRTAMVQPVVSDESSGGENSSGVHDVNRHISSPDSDRDEVDSGREDSA